MAHCPECEASFSGPDDVEFVDIAAKPGFVKASKRFYLVACSDCGVAIGSGVAGK